MVHLVPLSALSDVLTAVFGLLFLLFFIAVASVIVLGLLVVNALPYIVGFVGGLLSTLAEADDTSAGHATGRSSQKESPVSTGTGSNAPESRRERSETVGHDSGSGPYETNEYGELVEKN
ncbi:hypothetical protein EXE46_13030 [Halorubrum sp. GN11_10-6_MGM]|uniref:hypothetical protein n=1 Tax=Halorubrum sp. GN11_10-6_MGM TaxID=2518112 RepID=UPI0010F9388C|nr:hypothetical protein [Halorubrum sp. GN11_10-6_MGM]TKX73714.1 hypothetical protein EXE46_13030 [Halorubrum sp. GN11_10-6_MGM]